MLNKSKIIEEVIKSRCSTRIFTKEKIDKNIIRKIVEAGIYAPSASNFQNQRFLIIENADEIERIGRSRFVWPYKKADQEKMKSFNPSGIIGNATAIIIVFADSKKNDQRGLGEYYIWESVEIQNCSASIENILLMATSIGIGNCWVSASDKMNYTRLFSGKSWRKLLANYDIPDYYKIQGEQSL